MLRGLVNDGFTVHRFFPEGGNVYSLSNLFKLQKLITAGAYDIVHTHNTACQIFGAICRAPRGTKKVTTEHNTTNRRRRFAASRHADRMMYAAYDRVVCISEPALTALTDFLGSGIAEKCEVIANGIHLDRFSNSTGRIDPDGDVRVVMVAGFREQKDQDTAVRAMALLPRKFRLKLVGDGARIGEVRGLASGLGVADRVEFAGFRDDVPGLLKESDIVLMSSHYEGLSLSNIEGMASGRPFVASDVPGLREATAGAGILFPEGDDAALARILLNLAGDPELYSSTARKCKERAAGFDIRSTSLQYMECYRKLLHARLD